MSWKDDALVHAKDQDPKESVGLLLNVRGKQKYFPCQNLSISNHQEFILNPEDYVKAEKFLKRAVELMPDDPIVNDHYGDILWKLNRKIQARYFWANALEMEDIEKDMLEIIKKKLIEGLKNS